MLIYNKNQCQKYDVLYDQVFLQFNVWFEFHLVVVVVVVVGHSFILNVVKWSVADIAASVGDCQIEKMKESWKQKQIIKHLNTYLVSVIKVPLRGIIGSYVYGNSWYFRLVSREVFAMKTSL